MKTIVRRARRCGLAFAAAVLPVGLVVDVAASPQRRGGMYGRPGQANLDNSDAITGLNKALTALSETGRDYDGHREKAITHIGVAIRHLEPPNAKARGNAAVSKALAGKGAGKNAGAPDTDSDASVRKALTALFSVHHKLTDNPKNSTPGRLRADSEIRIALSELGAALKPATPAAATAPASGKPGK